MAVIEVQPKVVFDSTAGTLAIISFAGHSKNGSPQHSEKVYTSDQVIAHASALRDIIYLINEGYADNAFVRAWMAALGKREEQNHVRQ